MLSCLVSKAAVCVLLKLLTFTFAPHVDGLQIGVDVKHCSLTHSVILDTYVLAFTISFRKNHSFKIASAVFTDFDAY